MWLPPFWHRTTKKAHSSDAGHGSNSKHTIIAKKKYPSNKRIIKNKKSKTKMVATKRDLCNTLQRFLEIVNMDKGSNK